MRLLPICAILFTLTGGDVNAQAVWTNTAGRVFKARLEGLTDTQVTFVMEDGKTNVIALGALDTASQAAARRAGQLPEIPAVLRATFDLCVRDMRRADTLFADQRLDEAEYAATRRKILAGFHAMYVKHALPATAYSALEQRLLDSNKPNRKRSP